MFGNVYMWIAFLGPFTAKTWVVIVVLKYCNVAFVQERLAWVVFESH